jgi:hypothetical protein
VVKFFGMIQILVFFLLYFLLHVKYVKFSAVIRRMGILSSISYEYRLESWKNKWIKHKSVKVTVYTMDIFV